MRLCSFVQFVLSLGFLKTFKMEAVPEAECVCIGFVSLQVLLGFCPADPSTSFHQLVKL